MEERVREMEKLRRLKTYRQNPDILLRLPDGGPPAPVTPPSSRPPLELKFRKTKFPTEVYQLAHDYVQESSKKLKKEIRSRACDLVKAARTDCSPRFFTYLNFAVRIVFCSMALNVFKFVFALLYSIDSGFNEIFFL